MNIVVTRPPSAMARLFSACLIAATLLPPPALSQVGGGRQGTIPTIRLNDVPLTDAIRTLAQQANINFILDPGLSDSSLQSEGKPAREPSVTACWTNVSAEEALGALLKGHGLVMASNPVTSIVRITTPNRARPPAPLSPVGSDTNQVVPLIVMDSVPLADALKTLARQAGLEYRFDPSLSAGVPGPDGKSIVRCVAIRWQNVSAKQALAALVETYDLMIVAESAASPATIMTREKADAGSPQKLEQKGR
jgi:hypothetical protein